MTAESALSPIAFAFEPYWILIPILFVAPVLVRRFSGLVMTLRAVSFTPWLSRMLSRLLGSYDYNFEQFLRADGAGDAWVSVRREGLMNLARQLGSGRPRSEALSSAVRDGLSDLRFADANRVPFPFARVMRERFDLCSVAEASAGPRLRDADGNWTLDISGSYGVNVAGNEQYKAWIEGGWEKVRELGPVVLGPLHPVVAENIALLKQISGLDEVSFHMSGTEAVMAAVRLARFNTRRRKIVCFAGAYHGWWDGVQPGLGSERPIDDVIA